MRNLVILTVAALTVASSLNAAPPPIYNYDNVANFLVGPVTIQNTPPPVGGLILSNSVKLNGSTLQTAFAELLNCTVDGDPKELFCISPDKDLGTNPLPYLEYAPTGRLGWLVHQAATAKAAVDANDQIAGLNIAIWEIAYDFGAGNPYDLDAGNLQILGNFAAKTAAQNWLNALGTQVMPYSYYAYNGTGSKQDLIGDPSSTPPVPEPASVAMALGSLSALVGYRRLRKA